MSPRHWSPPCSWPVSGEERILLCLPCSKRICQRPPLFQDSGTSWIPQNNGSPRHPLPQGSEATGRSFILPMVWERGAEWGDQCKPPVHWALSPWASVQKVSIVFYYHIGQDAMPCPRVSAYALPQRQPGQRSRKVYLEPTRLTYQWLHPMLLVAPPIGVPTTLDYKAPVEKIKQFHRGCPANTNTTMKET